MPETCPCMQMGLDACVGDFRTSVSSYGEYHRFRTAVCDHLEGGVWGKKFPFLQNHSDCDGGYTPEEAKVLLKELEKVEQGLREVKYPVAIYYGANGEELCRRTEYSDVRLFYYNQSFEDFGVTGRGLVLSSKDPMRLPLPPDEKGIGTLGQKVYCWYFKDMEWIDGNPPIWVGKRADGTSVKIEHLYHDNMCAPYECVRIETGEMSAQEIFKEIINALKEICQKSISTNEPIVFC